MELGTLILGWWTGWLSMAGIILFFEWYYKKYKKKCVSCERKFKEEKEWLK
jgi:hypothetical protein